MQEEKEGGEITVYYKGSNGMQCSFPPQGWLVDDDYRPMDRETLGSSSRP